MFKRIFQLYKIARKLASSGALETVDEIYNLPKIILVFFQLFSVGVKKNFINKTKKPGEKLCEALEGMGTTFIKLGQFLATRPDIIGNELANDLEKLQDKLPPFNTQLSKQILIEELGEDQFKQISNFSEPIAAASIAQVHTASIKLEARIKM